MIWPLFPPFPWPQRRSLMPTPLRSWKYPTLSQVQIESFNRFRGEGLRELFREVSPIQDFTGGRFELDFVDHEFQEPKYSEQECRQREITYSAPMYVTARLTVKDTSEVKEQKLFLGDIPIMTSNGTFVINGAERVVVSQLVRSPGVYFTTEEDAATGRILAMAKFVPYRGAWLEFETSSKDVVSVKVDRKRKIPVTTLLRAIGLSSDKELLGTFKDVDDHPDHRFIQTTLDRDSGVKSREEALLEFYKHLRPGEPPSLENAQTLLDNLFFNPRRYDLGESGAVQAEPSFRVGHSHGQENSDQGGHHLRCAHYVADQQRPSARG